MPFRYPPHCGRRLLQLRRAAVESVCGRCDAGETRCGLCRRMEPPFARAVAYGSYDGGLRELIHLLKYEQVRPAAMVLGRMLAEAVSGLDSCWTRRPVMVVPVPLHARKLRQRGFNQSELIARAAIKQDAMTRSREAAGWSCTRDPGTPARNPIPDRTYAPSAPRKYPWFLCCGQAGGNCRPRNSAGR